MITEDLQHKSIVRRRKGLDRALHPKRIDKDI